jgi:hypothetical protein
LVAVLVPVSVFVGVLVAVPVFVGVTVLVAVLVAVTVAPAMTAPAESLIVPVISPVVICAVAR